MKIGKLKLKNNLILAPMEEITNLPFRLLCRKYGASLCFSEMVHVNVVSRKNKVTMKRVETNSKDKPFGVQLVGTRLDLIRKSVKVLKGKYDVLDFNFGCPSSKVVKEGAGAALLERPKKIFDIVETLVSCSENPVTGKIRVHKKNILKVAEMIEKAGASAITVHGRTLGQGYSGKASWDFIKKVKESVSIPVIGNGDVKDKESYDNLLKETKCDGVMIGRGSIGNPGVFSEILTGKKIDKFKMYGEFFKLCDKLGYDNIKILKQQAQYFTKGLIGGADLRSRLGVCKSADKIKDIMKVRNL